jgi:hypothetical protein
MTCMWESLCFFGSAFQNVHDCIKMWKCVCVRVCVREREREKWQGESFLLHLVYYFTTLSAIEIVQRILFQVDHVFRLPGP